MTAPRPEDEAIFHAARDILDPAHRREYVREACLGDEPRVAHIEALLAAADAPDSMLDHPAGSELGATVDRPDPPGPGTWIGPYRLIEAIGEGGMGTVWMAQQTEPVRRLVALKLIKAGMDSRQVVARFEAERQSLAVMDHPNIAKVLDGGATNAGRPYFVMDLVEGIPITRYADEHRFTLRQRLELFIPVCRAVQHAHQKGIIHRDLKPSNVLVALYDSKPVPKVIDFGVAKATGQSLTGTTPVTSFGAIVGTLEYMSPEQAEINQLDVDTRSDIYSLGVLLYELLTGSPPFTRKELEKAGMLEMLRVIREQEPSRPSTKLSTADGLPTLAANRGTEPANLTRLVRGELDWIVMKAMEKDRARRYESANGLADDVGRYLADEPVRACPPSSGYRLRKFVRRNKGPVLAISLGVLALLSGLIGTTWGMLWALNERDAKETARQAAETSEQRARTAGAEARIAEGKARTAGAQERKAREQALARLDQMEKVNLTLGSILTDIAQSRADASGKPVKAFFAERLDIVVAQLDVAAIDDPLILARLQSTFGSCYFYLSAPQKGIPLLEKAVKVRKAGLGPDHPDTLESMQALALCYRFVRRLPDALSLYEEVLKLHEDRLGPGHIETLKIMDVLALGYLEAGRMAEAVSLADEVARRRQPDDPRSFVGADNRATIYQAAGRGAEAMAMREEVVRLHRDKFGPDHEVTLVAMAQLGRAYRLNAKFDKAVSLGEELLKLNEGKYGPDHDQSLHSMSALGSAYMAAGRAADALPVLTDVVPRLRTRFGLQNVATQQGMRNLIDCHERLGQHDRAEPLHREWADFWKRQAGPNSTAHAGNLASLGRNLLKQHKPDQAEPVLRSCLALFTRNVPDLWTTFEATSLVGGALLDQENYPAAEPFLLDGYRGMEEREAKMPGKVALLEAAARLVGLYEALGNADEAARWRKVLGEIQGRIKDSSGPPIPNP